MCSFHLPWFPSKMCWVCLEDVSLMCSSKAYCRLQSVSAFSQLQNSYRPFIVHVLKILVTQRTLGRPAGATKLHKPLEIWKLPVWDSEIGGGAALVQTALAGGKEALKHVVQLMETCSSEAAAETFGPNRQLGVGEMGVPGAFGATI